VELQSSLPLFAAHGIAVFAISYDPVETLAAFATAHAITFPLLSDEGSRVIDALGIRNTGAEPGSRAWGVPYPGTYSIGADGRVADKRFRDGHRTRDAAVTALREGFALDVQGDGPRDRQGTDALIAVASLDSGGFVRGERIGLRVDIRLAPGIHLYGQPLPEGYIPTVLTVAAPPPATAEPVVYPEPRPFRPDWLDASLPVYVDALTLTAAVVLTDTQEDATITATLDYQACTADECLLPGRLTFTLPLTFRPFPM